MDQETPQKKRRWMKRIVLFIALSIIYVITAVPVGMFIYTVKSDFGINVFSKTGYHAYAQCLREQAYKIKILEKTQKANIEKKQDN